jgi:hypothetical protein
LPGDIPVPGDYDGDSITDYAVWRPSIGVWFIVPSSNPSSPLIQQWGLPGDIAVGPYDFDGDFKADYAVWRPLSQILYIIPSTNPTVPIAEQSPSPSFLFTAGQLQIAGIQGAVWARIEGDFDGDGVPDFALWSLTDGTSGVPTTGTWYIVPSSNPGAPITQQWGIAGDLPVAGDFDGDRKTDFAVWRPSTGNWYVIPSSNPGAPTKQAWGVSGDIPIQGDFDGDGKADYAFWRPSEGNWYVIPSSNPGAPITQPWGLSGDIPVAGDFDGDRKTDFAVWRPADGSWYVIPSSNPGAPYVQQWGLPDDIPIPGDFNGDGKADYNIWRPVTAINWVALNGSLTHDRRRAVVTTGESGSLQPDAYGAIIVFSGRASIALDIARLAGCFCRLRRTGAEECERTMPKSSRVISSGARAAEIR